HVQESASRLEVALNSHDGRTSIAVAAHLVDKWPRGSIFASLDEASAFFQAGSIGYSPTAIGSRFDGLELRCPAWRVEPLSIEHVHSSFFDDITIFPRGSVELDC